MTDDLYLTSLKARQFRTFAELDVELDPEPGVLIVQGSNGLGKSSLIHGIEWALTDRIDNFRNAAEVRRAGRYLCRWKKPTGEATSISLGFSDGASLTRSLAGRQSARSVLTGIADPATYLKHPEWSPQIEDLSHYLLLTHFLAQTNLSRFAYRADGERFNILRDAARSDVEDRIAKALHGPGQTVQARAYKTVIDQLQKEIQTVDDALMMEGQAWVEAQTAGALDDEASTGLADRILQLLGQLGDTGGASFDLTDLSSLASRVEERGGRLRTRRAELDLAVRLRADFGEATEGRAAATAALAAVMTALEAQPQAVSRAEAWREALSFRQAAALQARVDAELRANRLLEVTEARAKAQEDSRNLHALAASIADAAARRDTAARDLARTERRAALVARLSHHADGWSARVGANEGRTHRVQALIDRHIRLDQASLQLRALRAVSPEAEEDLRAAQAAVEASAADTQRLEPGLAALREASDAISAAVVSIVSNLPETACECPVCATTFGDSATLRARATNAASSLAPELERQQQALDAVRHRHAEDLRLLNRLEAVSKAIEQAQRTYDAEASAWAAGLETEGLRPDAGLASLHSLIEGLELEAEALRRQLDRTRRRLQILTQDGRVDYAAAVIDSARTLGLMSEALREAEARHAGGERLHRSQMQQIGDLTTDLFGTSSVEDAELRLATEAATTAAKSARETQAALEAELGQADSALNRLATQRSTFDAEREQLVARVEELNATRDALSESWGSLQKVGAIDDAGGRGLIEAETAYAKAREAFDEAEIQLANLRTGRVAWSRQQGHAVALMRLRKIVDAASNAPRADLIAAAESKAVRTAQRLEATLTARQIASRASDRITAELNEFNTEYIQPLGRLMTRINRSILCDPSVGIRFKVTGKKVEQASVKDGQQPDELGDVDPMLVHSEGQMAALGVSLLCAASLTFPWSRWKALVLDDPLQHNDAIHASAFADFIANLVTARKYQVILSSHDAAQAEFLQRKFAARRIPCKTVSLIGMGPKGVEEIIRGPAEGLRLAKG